MDKIRLGRTGLNVARCGFGALPIQRIGREEAGHILRKAFDNGINFFDTARMYSDSENKIGHALADVREDILIATKTAASDRKALFGQLESSLQSLKTDYIDVYQLHNPESLPNPEEPEGLYQALLEAKNKGMIRFIGISSHRLTVALEAAASKLYDTVQFPLSSISSDEDIKLIDICKRNDVGLIAMKALAGGLISNVSSSFAFLRQFDNVVPIWGIQRESELNEFLSLEADPPVLDAAMLEIIKKDRSELAGSFCRGCGYCMPCPAGIPISMAARMSLLLARAPYQGFLTDTCKERMELISGCTECGQCKRQCPYGLDTPNLLKYMLKYYMDFYRKYKKSLQYMGNDDIL